jgi:endonuclease YncB( thermonuclease family)
MAGVSPPPVGTRLAQDATKQLHMLLAGKSVEVDFNTLTASADILGRVLHGGRDINLRMLEAGLLRFAPAGSLAPEIQDQYRQAEYRAQRLGLGMWKRQVR